MMRVMYCCCCLLLLLLFGVRVVVKLMMVVPPNDEQRRQSHGASHREVEDGVISVLLPCATREVEDGVEEGRHGDGGGIVVGGWSNGDAIMRNGISPVCEDVDVRASWDDGSCPR